MIELIVGGLMVIAVAAILYVGEAIARKLEMEDGV